MLPILLKGEWLGIRFAVPGFGFALASGLILGLVLIIGRAREAGLARRALTLPLAAALVCAWAGARAAFDVQYAGTRHHGGIVLLGGLVGGFLGGMVAGRAAGLCPLRLADLVAPCVLAAVAVGRLGCLLGGCCFGVPAGWGVAYPVGSLAWRAHRDAGWVGPEAAGSIPTVPAPLLEAAALLAIAALLSMLWRRRPPAGRVLAAAAALYGAWRLAAESWRGDHEAWWFGLLTFSQGLSVLLLALAPALARLRPVPVRPLCWRRAVRPAAALLALCSLTCAPPPRAMEMAGETVLPQVQDQRKELHEKRKEAHEKLKDAWDDDDDDEGFFEHCLNECMKACIDACIEACCEALCESVCKGDEVERRPRPPPKSGEPPDPLQGPEALARALEAVPEGRESAFLIRIYGDFNDRLPVDLNLEGVLVLERRDGGAHFSGRVAKANLSVGATRLEGAGDLRLTLAPGFRLKLEENSLPEPWLRLLKSTAGFFGDWVVAAGDAAPLPEPLHQVTRELALPGARARASGRVEFAGFVLPFEAAAERAPDDPPRLAWRIRFSR